MRSSSSVCVCFLVVQTGEKTQIDYLYREILLEKVEGGKRKSTFFTVMSIRYQNRAHGWRHTFFSKLKLKLEEQAHG